MTLYEIAANIINTEFLEKEHPLTGELLRQLLVAVHEQLTELDPE